MNNDGNKFSAKEKNEQNQRNFGSPFIPIHFLWFSHCLLHDNTKKQNELILQPNHNEIYEKCLAIIFLHQFKMVNTNRRS